MTANNTCYGSIPACVAIQVNAAIAASISISATSNAHAGTPAAGIHTSTAAEITWSWNPVSNALS